MIHVADNEGYGYGVVFAMSKSELSSDSEIEMVFGSDITNAKTLPRVICQAPFAASGLTSLEDNSGSIFGFKPDGSNADKIIDMRCDIKTPSTWALKLVPIDGVYQHIETSLLSDTGASLDDFYRIKKFKDGSFAGGRMFEGNNYQPSIIDITLKNKNTPQSSTGSYMFNNANSCQNRAGEYCPNKVTDLTTNSKETLKVLTYNFNSAVFKIGNTEIYGGSKDGDACGFAGSITNQESMSCYFDKISVTLERNDVDINYIDDNKIEELDVKFIVSKGGGNMP